MAFEEMVKMVAGLGDQLRWAENQEVPGVPPASIFLVAGMGGSGISGDLVGGLSHQLVTVHKSYGLPGWARKARPQVVAVSYSGNTEETLSSVEAAATLGLVPYVVTGGGRLSEMATTNGWPLVMVPAGLQPRAALGYLLGSLVRVLFGAGALTPDAGSLGRAADLADTLVSGAGDGWALAADLADGLTGRVAAIYGSTGLTAAIAQRWKTQINENAKWPAWHSNLPELDHNEIVSWGSLSELTRKRVGIIALRDRDEPDEVAARFRHTATVTAKDVAWVGEVWSQGESRLERLVSLCVVGDLLSLELARVAGVDPVPVDAIETLKRRMSEERQVGSTR
ncbi:MAG: bifunctional phosphoglucose/phosphomannose isomerase [Actinomycetota bacterium]